MVEQSETDDDGGEDRLWSAQLRTSDSLAMVENDQEENPVKPPPLASDDHRAGLVRINLDTLQLFIRPRFEDGDRWFFLGGGFFSQSKIPFHVP